MTRDEGVSFSRSTPPADGVCRTPWKIPYTTRRDAAHAERRIRGRVPGQLKPYHCSCGNWHLSHLTSRAAKQIKRRRNMAA